MVTAVGGHPDVPKRVSLIVTVKAYPAISRKYHEAVCVAGIRTDTDRPEWARLYPVPFRDLPFAQRFKKYQLISLRATKHSTDQRPETLRPDIDSLELGDTIDTKRKDGWSRRAALVEPLVVESMCEVLRRQRADGTSLAAFRPGEVLDLIVDREEAEWTGVKAGVVAQPSLFFPTKDGLEKIPFRFRYHYRCGPKCSGHTQSMIDWELAQAVREWRRRYSDESTLLEKIRQRFLDEMCGPKKDTIFFVGNQHVHRESFLVLGVFWPPLPS